MAKPMLISFDRAQEFADLITQIGAEYIPQACKIAKRDGLEAAIAFCHSKLQPSVMQAQRDFEQGDSQE